MSMYNLVHGENPYASVFLALLGLKKENIPRYRDCWWDGEYVCIHTRSGGAARETYESPEQYKLANPGDNAEGPWNSDLQAHPNYVKDEDAVAGDTYATFYFTIPKAMEWAIPHLQKTETTPSERWSSFIERMQSPDSKDDPNIQRALEAFAPIFDQLKKKLDDK